MMRKLPKVGGFGFYRETALVFQLTIDVNTKT